MDKGHLQWILEDFAKRNNCKLEDVEYRIGKHGEVHVRKKSDRIAKTIS